MASLRSESRPPRTRILQALDVLMEVAAPPSSGSLRPQFLDFAKDHRRLADEEDIIGYGFPGNGSFYKHRKGEDTVVFYIDNDDKADRLERRVPAKMDFPGVTRSIQTEIINVGTVTPLSLTGRLRPAQPGISISHFRMTAGTFGVLVKRTTESDDNLYILSSNHVLTEYNAMVKNALILQPGVSDGGRDADNIAELAELVSLEYDDKQYNNRVDAAIGRVLDPGAVRSELIYLGQPSGIGRAVRRGMSVQIVGRTSGRSVGQVVDPEARLRLKYPRGKRTTAYVGFADIVLCTPFTQKGDSGAAVLSDDNKVVGLVMAGGSRATVFCKMSYICDMLKLDLAEVA